MFGASSSVYTKAKSYRSFLGELRNRELDIGTIVALIIAGISAIATVVIAVFTYKTIQAYEKQVQIGRIK